MNNILSISVKHIRRSPYQALAAIAVLTLTLLVACIFSLTALGSREILHYFETRPQVTAFFTDTATLQDMDKLKVELESKDFVKTVKLVSQEEALAIYREQNKDDPLLLEMVTADMLPASLEVSGITAQVLPQIASAMEGKAGVEEVVYQKDVVDTLSSWTKGLRIAGLILLGFLTFTSVLTLMVIIGMKIAVRRHEVEVLRLIGASNWYISGPFLFEGMFYGVVAAVVAWGTTYLGLLYATPFLVSFLGSLTLLPVPILTMLALLGAELLLGILIGSLGSLIAVRRFFR